MSNEKERTVTLHTYTDASQAEMMQYKLKENGIGSFLNNENVMGLDPIAGVELKVFERDLAKAEEILRG
jgi:Putative prokaryotic signal transducing protein